MRVLPVAQRRAQRERLAGEDGPARRGVVGKLLRQLSGQLLGEPPRHRDVVGRGVGKGLGRQPPAGREIEPAGAHGDERVVVRPRRDDHGHVGVVLGRGPDQRGSADVDLLHALLHSGAGCHGLLERVEVAHDEVERRDPQLRELVGVLGAS